MNKADVLSHVSIFQLRTGNSQEALDSINKALDLFDQNWDQEKDPHRKIWKAAAIANKDLILYNKRD